MSSKVEIAARVAKGIEWLDENVPDWRSKISLDRFDIRATCNCVIGQVFGNFYHLIDNEVLTRADTYDLGFYSYSSGGDERYGDWDLLEDEWKRVLKDAT